jgi:tRNA-dihydrouridine synthase B
VTLFPPVSPSPPPVKTEAGGLTLDSPLLLAPLAGITIPPLRLFFSRLGAAAVHTEMISCSGLIRSNGKTDAMLDLLPGEAPAVVQLFAGDEDTLLGGAERALAGGVFKAVGINMACPMPKVLKKGAGARLMERPRIAFAMTAALARCGLPVWPKIRKCPPGYPLTTEEFCCGLLDAGAAMVCLHGRTPAQRYAGDADRDVVAQMAARFPGRICASGDVYTPGDAAGYLEKGCPAVLLARGAVADPFLFARTLAFMGRSVHNKYADPAPEFRKALAVSLGGLVEEYMGSRAAALFTKRMLPGIFKGVRGSGPLRRAVADKTSWPCVRHEIENFNGYLERREL